MAIHLYQSKKAQRYIGQQVYDDIPWEESEVDPLTLWYVDVFFIERERYLVFTNPLTKFTYFLFRYTKKTHPDFLEAFRKGLAQTLQAANLKSNQYLSNCDVLVPFYSTNKSASAHLSRMKEAYQWMIEHNHHGIAQPEDEAFYNGLAAKEITTYGKKDYNYPYQRFYHELLLRRWTD